MTSSTNGLESLVDRAYDLSIEDLNKTIYQSFILEIAKNVCKQLDNGEERKKFLNYVDLWDYVVATRFLLKDYNLSEQEIKYISNIVSNYLVKDGRRVADVQKYKKSLYKKQNGKCNSCCKDISYEDAVIDHIIPYSLVGDGVNNSNLQLLCVDCNLKKTNDPWFPIHFLIKTKKMPKYAEGNFMVDVDNL